MKHFILVCSTFWLLNIATAQTKIIFNIDSLPEKGLQLNQTWLYRLSDSIEFSGVDYDDRNWSGIDPSKDIFDLPAIPKNGEIFWLRFHFTLNEKVTDRPVLEIRQSGASEIFFNGKLIRRTGTISDDPDSIRARTFAEQPLNLPVVTIGVQTIAVRYALQPHLRYGTHFASNNLLFSVKMTTLDNWFDDNKLPEREYDLNTSIGCLLIVLCFCFLALYFFYSKKSVYLFFIIYTFIFAISYGYSGLFKHLDVVGFFYWKNNVILSLSIMGSLCLLLALYKIVKEKAGYIFVFILLFGLICIPLSFWVYKWGWVVFGIGFSLINSVEIFRISLMGVRKKIKGAQIIAFGSISYFILWILFLGYNSLSGSSSGYGPYFYALAQLCMPLSVAFYLAYDFAQTNKVLQYKLLEVESLSLEKQHILATQNENLERQVLERTSDLNKSLVDLKSTQQQLIQSEKMASLGELTAGIAHEIQNPLNFVNNFSEVNRELLVEMKEELSKGNYDEVNSLAGDIQDNEQKINEHGKRAESIVKGMLLHSRVSSGAKELTDINKQTDEFLRLAYHGFRGKDKAFNAAMETNYDQTVGSINVVPQEIGRVLLNLINNAFYAVNEKKRQQPDGYEPTVSVSTKRTDSKVVITVKDNGNGIPQKVIDKIFQPFFTTKPTGQGTGLGLSLAYDIVKAHGGEINVVTVQGEGSEFIIELPVVDS